MNVLSTGKKGLTERKGREMQLERQDKEKACTPAAVSAIVRHRSSRVFVHVRSSAVSKHQFSLKPEVGSVLLNDEGTNVPSETRGDAIRRLTDDPMRGKEIDFWKKLFSVHLTVMSENCTNTSLHEYCGLTTLTQNPASGESTMHHTVSVVMKARHLHLLDKIVDIAFIFFHCNTVSKEFCLSHCSKEHLY